MTTFSHERSRAVPDRPRWPQLVVRETWASLAISVMWLAVLFDAIFGPDIVTSGVAGDRATVPSAVAVALFAFLATWVVAKYGLARRDRTET